MRGTLSAAVVFLGVVTSSLDAQNQASDLAAIVAGQQALAREFESSPFSPFTAVASRYFSGGDLARLVVRGATATFDETSAPGGAVDVTFDGREMWVTPVPGGPPVGVLRKQGTEGVEAGPGTPVRGRTRIGDQDLVRVGRHYLETGARPGSGRAIVYDPEAPLRKAYTGLHWFPPATTYQVKAAYTPIERPDPVVVTTSRGLEKEFFRAGVFSFELDGRALRLVALATTATPKTGDELFVPFRDATTGRESYAVGRYLHIRFKGAGEAYLIDFNLAVNPYCAYSPHYNCVIPPKENTLPVAIRAGELIYAKH
jgi:hypothetical protein